MHATVASSPSSGGPESPVVRIAEAPSLTDPQAAATPIQERLLVPLSLLCASRRNVRAMPSPGIAALAESIGRVGLLQNLSVMRVGEAQRYEVVAGSRRLAALRLLVKSQRLPRDWPVPCLLVAPAAARTASLSENLHREAMHPADEFAAFAALAAEGRPIADIAADFGVTPLVVQRRLRLANVSPRLMADYRSGAVTLEQLMALAITDDYAAQEAAFYDAPEWQRSAAALKARLTEREVRCDSPVARFVGREAYLAAGGTIRRDLFDEDATAGYFSDSELLHRLATDRLEAQADAVRSEGWAWVDCVPQLSFADQRRMTPAPRERRQPKAGEARRLAALDARIAKLDNAIAQATAARDDCVDDEEQTPDAATESQDGPHDSPHDGPKNGPQDEAELDALHAQRDTLLERRDRIEQSLFQYAPAVMALAGAIVTIDREGRVLTLRGQLREDAAKSLRAQGRREAALTAASDGGSSEEPAMDTFTGISDRLMQRLSAQRTVALQIELARHPHVALASLVHMLVQRCLHDGYRRSDLPLGVTLSLRSDLERLDATLPEVPAARALRESREAWVASLPTGNEALFTALLGRTQDELVQLLAVCVAATVDVVVERASFSQPGEAIARAVAFDMARWWQPTSAGYFDHLSKASILAAAREFAPEEVARLAKLKKGELASEAERLVGGTGWMPTVLRATGKTADQ